MASRGIRPRFRGLSPCGGQVAYVLLTRAPVAGGRKQASAPAAPRLACVKPVASVHPEPGSNSPLLLCCFLFFQKDSCRHAPGQRSGRLCPARHPLFDSSDQELTGVSVPLFVTLCSCTSLAFVYCNTFNVLSSLTPAPGGRGEKRCKVTDCFPFRQIFRQLFFQGLPADQGRGASGAAPQTGTAAEGPPSPKASAKLHLSQTTSKFSGKNIPKNHAL